MCPPGTDQTTRGPQRWYLLSPAVGEKVHMPVNPWSGECKTMRDLVIKMTTSKAFEKLARRDLSPPRPLKRVIINHNLSSIENLPTELLAMILSSPNLTKEHVAAFGVCSQTIWMHTLRHIQAAYRNATGAWAGIPLVCTGTYLVKLPPALQETIQGHEAEEQAWIEWLNQPRSQFEFGGIGMCPSRRWNWNAVSSFQEVGDQDIKEEWKKAVSDAGLTASNELMDDLEDVLRVDPKPVAGRWLLRNLTQKEFVKLDINESSDGAVQATVLNAPALSLDKAILSRISWSDTDSDWDDSEVLFYRGKWAGCSFDVVKYTESSFDGWQDATEALTKHAFALGLC